MAGVQCGRIGFTPGNDVGALVEVEASAGVAGVCDRDGPPALQAGNPVQLPSGTESSRRLPGRQVVVDGDGEAVFGVEARRSAFRKQVAGILRKGDAGGEVDAVGGVVDRLREVVTREAGDAVRVLDAQRGLQRVVDRRGPGEELVHGAEVWIGQCIAIGRRVRSGRSAGRASCLCCPRSRFRPTHFAPVFCCTFKFQFCV